MTNRHCATPLEATRKFGCVVYAPALLSAAVAYLGRYMAFERFV